MVRKQWGNQWSQHMESWFGFISSHFRSYSVNLCELVAQHSLHLTHLSDLPFNAKDKPYCNITHLQAMQWRTVTDWLRCSHCIEPLPITIHKRVMMSNDDDNTLPSPPKKKYKNKNRWMDDIYCMKLRKEVWNSSSERRKYIEIRQTCLHVSNVKKELLFSLNELKNIHRGRLRGSWRL